MISLAPSLRYCAAALFALALGACGGRAVVLPVVDAATTLDGGSDGASNADSATASDASDASDANIGDAGDASADGDR